MDGQGAERVRPYVETAGVTFPVVIDAEATIGQLYGFKHVGHGFLVDEDGRLSYAQAKGFDIRRPEMAESLELWATTDTVPDDKLGKFSLDGSVSSEGDSLFKTGLRLYQKGDHEEAVAQWREALEIEPDSIIIHRHIWAVENPERFYDGEIDQEWKRQQIAQGR